MKNKIIAASIAMVMILICFVPIFIFFGRERKENYGIVCFGDSVMACYYGDGSIPYYLEEITGYPTLNAAFGGLSMSVPSIETISGDTSYLYSMAELSEALVNKDFSLQIMGTKPRVNEYPERWNEIPKVLDNLNYESIEYIIIEHGVNDYLLGKPIDNPNDPYDVYSFAGALRTVIENVRKAVPGATIVLTTPTYCYIDYVDKDCYEADFGGGTLPDYVAKEKEIAAEYGVICVDNFNESGITKDNYKDYLYDGLHSHQGGNLLIADNIVDHLEGTRRNEITP